MQVQKYTKVLSTVISRKYLSTKMRRSINSQAALFDADFLFGTDSPTYEHLGIFPEICMSLQKYGKTTATRIQNKSLGVILDGNDTLITAETGSGKTLAYLIPLLQQFIARQKLQDGLEVGDNHHNKSTYPRGIILAPNR